jgi:hypothetical protein
VDPQTIGVSTGVIGTAIAGLALFLNWDRGRKRKSRTVLVCGGIVAIAGITVGLAFGLSGGTPGVTQAQYRQEAGEICLNMKTAGLHAAQLDPQKPAGAVAADLEAAAIIQLKALRVPPNLSRLHSDAVSTWERRVALLKSIDEQPPLQDQAELDKQYAEPLALQATVRRLFAELGVSECSLG